MNIEALFLGPQAENRKFFKEILGFLVDEHIHWRRNFHPHDAPSITLDAQRQESFAATQQRIEEVLLELSSKLKSSSLPWHSPRYLGHMCADLLLPAHLAYMATMLYNPNNVAWEASPVTTELELKVGLELAHMLGFDPNQAFGHVTSGGTVANIEAVWVARNLKSIPLAIKQVQSELVAGLSEWELLNLSPSRILELISQVEAKIDAVKKYSVRGEGMNGFKLGKIFVPATKHYSWHKMVDVLGIGRNNLVVVKVTPRYSLDIDDLRAKLAATLAAGEPILAVIGVVGTTEEGAVDPIDKIVALRREFEQQGNSFYIHLDAAYGGYARTIFLDEALDFMPYPVLKQRLAADQIIETSLDYPPRHVYDAFQAIDQVDSVTVDPHKWGYVPYQAGAVVFRDRRVRNIISYFAPYVFEEDNESQNPLLLGSYILEGSKSGAAAAAVWASHQVVPLHIGGYGQIIGKGIESALILHHMLLEQGTFVVGAKVYRVLPLVQPETNIVMYAFNEVGNSSLEAMNRLNRAIKANLYYEPGRLTLQYDFMVSSTSLSARDYGDTPLAYLRQLEIPDTEWGTDGEVFMLRSTIMTPYFLQGFNDTHYLAELFNCFQRILEKVGS